MYAGHLGACCTYDHIDQLDHARDIGDAHALADADQTVCPADRDAALALQVVGLHRCRLTPG